MTQEHSTTATSPDPDAAEVMRSDWVARFAEDVIAAADAQDVSRIVCASGISPSGPVHMGNLREVMTPHLVADEIRRRGRDVVHLLSWDDYDRFRRVPVGIAGVDTSWEEHIGKPLTSVPAPRGSAYANWADHFKAPLVEAMAELGIEVHPISQTTMYTTGAYREQILLAMQERARIDEVLGRYRTKKKAQPDDATADPAEAEQASGAALDEDGASEVGYFPYKPYCTRCEKDFTTVTSYHDDTTELTYECSACGQIETVKLSEFNHGKLVWKVDWPMRWAFEHVMFEPSGVDHSSPGSSFMVGSQLVSEIFGAPGPIGPMYAFVGITGQAKMSSSRGQVPTGKDALAIMEPQLLRWLYARRRPNQGFKVAFDAEIQRLYDEWDSLGRKVSAGTAEPADAAAYHRATGTQAVGPLPTTPRPVPYRTLASAVDVTTGDEGQLFRILTELDASDPIRSLDDVRPRLDRAATWVETYLPEGDRTQVRTAPDVDRLANLSADERASLRLLLDGLDSHWSLDGLTTLVYGVPKQQLGLALDTKPSPELKAAQRAFFVLLYELLIGKDTGPRLPTLLLAVGQDRLRMLLSPAEVATSQR